MSFGVRSKGQTMLEDQIEAARIAVADHLQCVQPRDNCPACDDAGGCFAIAIAALHAAELTHQAALTASPHND